MDWETLYCPNRACRLYGAPWPQSALVKNGSSRGFHQALCRACGQAAFLRYGTASFELEADPAIFEIAIERNLLTAKHLCEMYGDAWVWVAFAPVWRLVVAFVVGKRTQASANLLLELVVHVSDGSIPFFTSDQLPEYRSALLHAYGEWYQPARNGSRGRYPERRRKAPADLLYAQVVKQRKGSRVVAVTHKIVFGDAAAVQARLVASPVSAVVNTSFVERENLTLRQQNRRLMRKTSGFSKEISWLERQLWVSLAYYHLVLPHASLRRRLIEPEPTPGTGSARRWCSITPAMAAGLTDHVWTTAELLSYRVPASFVDQLPEIEPLFPLFDGVHHGY